MSNDLLQKSTKMIRRLKGLVTHKRKSLDTDLRFTAKNSFCLFDLFFYVPVNRYGHVGTLAVESSESNKREFLFARKRTPMSREFCLCVTRS